MSSFPSSLFYTDSTSAGVTCVMTDTYQLTIVLVETLLNSIKKICLVEFKESTDDIRTQIGKLHHAR